MKMPALVCLLICFFSTPVPTKAQNLKNLHELDIVVGGLREEAGRNLGLTKESMKDQVLVALKRDIPNVSIEKPSLSWVSLRVTCLPASIQSRVLGYACSVEMSLKRNVFLPGVSTAMPIIADVWEDSQLLLDSSGNMASQVRESIDEEITKLAAEYYKDNP